MKELKTKEDFESAVGKRVLLNCDYGKGEGWLFKANLHYYVQQDFADGFGTGYTTDLSKGQHSWCVWQDGMINNSTNSVHLIEEYQIDPNYVQSPYPLGTIGYVSDASEQSAREGTRKETLQGYRPSVDCKFVCKGSSWMYFVPLRVEPEPEYFITVKHPDGKIETKTITKEQWEGLQYYAKKALHKDGGEG